MNPVGFLAWGLALAAAEPSSAQFQEPQGRPAAGGGIVQPGGAFRPSTDQVANSGLGVRILFVGRNADGKSLTVSSEIQNLLEEPVHLALVGPPPAAIDTQGVTYDLVQHAGLPSCLRLDNDQIARCFLNYSNYLPGENFSLLQPGASAIVALTFASAQASDSGLLSVSLNVAMGVGQRPPSKRDAEHKLENVAISFPLVEVRPN